jgi:hypothetical protein
MITMELEISRGTKAFNPRTVLPVATRGPPTDVIVLICGGFSLPS